MSATRSKGGHGTVNGGHGGYADVGTEVSQMLRPNYNKRPKKRNSGN